MQGKTIVVADDEPHITYLLAMKLRQNGAVVHIAQDGAQAFQLACQYSPHLLISDFQMPLMSGFDLALKLRENLATTNIPIIMLTARGHRLIPSDLAKTNIQHLMAKPFSMRQVLNHAREFMNCESSPAEGAASQHPREAAV